MNEPAKQRREITAVLAGNPNVGKSTVFNSLTGLRHHTGNWTGKTVENDMGKFSLNGTVCSVFDLPGLYSMTPNSEEERAAADFLISGEYDVMIIVLDAVCMERNLRFAAEVLSQVQKPAAVCINLIDEAEKKGIRINTSVLSSLLGVPVIPAAASKGIGLDELKKTIFSLSQSGSDVQRCKCQVCGADCRSALLRPGFCEYALKRCVSVPSNSPDSFDRKMDNIMLSKIFSVPIMLLMLLVVFWITIVGANYPSEWLNTLFTRLGIFLRSTAEKISCPQIISGIFIDGVYTTLTWVVSVMLPPMAIFFPLFTLMEDAGILPRIAFNMDSMCMKAGVSGKQSLTSAMGFGCNACGVTGCRIIGSPKERLIAILTNSFIPCNGRFPTIIIIITMFLAGSGTQSGIFGSLKKAALLVLFVVLSAIMSLAVSWALSKVLKGESGGFVMELPPYRRPQILKVLVRSILDRTLFVLLRAVMVAAPAGIVIWLLANISVKNITLIEYITHFLEPLGAALGLDGAILAAFILGFPANEIVLPLAVMIYTKAAALSEVPDTMQLAALLTAQGWTAKTAVCAIIFTLFHAPCSTTCLTILKETKSLKHTAAAILLPVIVGAAMCFCLQMIL